MGKKDCHTSDIGHWFAMTGASFGLPLEGKLSRRVSDRAVTDEVELTAFGKFHRGGNIDTSSVIRLAGDAGCHLPLKGKANYSYTNSMRKIFFSASPLTRYTSPACSTLTQSSSPSFASFAYSTAIERRG